jgi:para-aminobenzoate synthetase component 1
VDVAIVAGQLATGLRDVTSDLTALDRAGRWAVVMPFDGPPICARFERWVPAPAAGVAGRPRPGPPLTGWTSSLGRDDYAKGVRTIRQAIAAGDVYQVNLCRRLSAPLPPAFDVVELATALAAHHPAPHAATVALPRAGVAVASASPECFLARRGDEVASRPIKGTAAPGQAFLAKDRAENVMIVDLVRNDLGRVCDFGSVEAPALCQVEEHPGLRHLVSTVRGHLRPGAGWAALLDATFPPGSVTGAPKVAALDMLSGLEPVPRGVYCGAIGWVDADRGAGGLSVAIRTFWAEDGRLHFGTGAGITWGSDPAAEWEETELKARRLLAVAAGGAHA